MVTRDSKGKKKVTDEEETQDDEGKNELMDIIFDSEETAKTDDINKSS